MAQRALWADKYSLGYQSSLTTAVAGSVGVFMFNHASANPQLLVYNADKSKATAANSYNYEYANSNKMPNMLIPTRVTPKEVYPFLRLFFQRGSLQDSTVNTKKWFYPYSYQSNGGSCEIWSSLIRETATTGTAKSHRVTGAICNDITINPVGRDYVNITANMLGRDIELNHETSGDTFTLPLDAPLLWRNATTKIGDSYTALETLDLKSFSMNIKNNARGSFYNNALVKRFNLERVTGNGSLLVPWENSSTNYTDNQVLTDLLNGSLFRLSVYWKDQYLASGYSLSINMLGRFVSGMIGNDAELSNQMQFIMAEDDSFTSSNSKVSTWAISGSTASQITLGFNSTETLLGNVFPGDILILTDALAGSNIQYEIERIISSTVLKLTTNHAAGTSANGTGVIIKRQPISIGLRDETNRNIT